VGPLYTLADTWKGMSNGKQRSPLLRLVPTQASIDLFNRARERKKVGGSRATNRPIVKLRIKKEKTMSTQVQMKEETNRRMTATRQTVRMMTLSASRTLE